jgi:hypothetical protein
VEEEAVRLDEFHHEGEDLGAQIAASGPSGQQTKSP